MTFWYFSKYVYLRGRLNKSLLCLTLLLKKYHTRGYYYGYKSFDNNYINLLQGIQKVNVAGYLIVVFSMFMQSTIKYLTIKDLMNTTIDINNRQ